MDEDLLAKLKRLAGWTPKPKLPEVSAGSTESLKEMIASPFVQDTLFSLTGGPPTAAFSSDLAMQISGLAKPYQGQTPLGFAIPPGIIATQKNPHISTLVHEMGHVADFRGMFPALREKAAESAKQSTGYAGRNRFENFAEAFEQAVRIIRGSGSEELFNVSLDYAAQANPLVPLMVETLLQEPIFEKHRARAWIHPPPRL